MQAQDLTLDQLWMFLAVVEEGSFSAAGRKLGRVQSAISYGIGNLEEVLGVELFDRSGRRPQLTANGHALLADIRQVRGQLEQLYGRARALTEGLEGEVSVVLDAFYPTAELVAVSREFLATFPSVNLRVHTEALGAVGHKLMEGAAQIGISGPDGLEGFRLHREAVAELELVPVAAGGHALAANDGRAATDELRKHVQIVLSDRSAATQGVDYGVLSHRTWRVADLATKLALLKAGLGWGSIPRHMVKDELDSGRLVALRSDAWRPHEWVLSMYAIYCPEKPPGPAAGWLLTALSKALSACAGKDR